MTDLYTVLTQHGVHREVRTVTFPDFDTALAYAKANDPDTDGTLCPNVNDVYLDHPGFQASVRWLGNRYAVVLKGETS